MKFNFEKIKKVIKKSALGTAVLLTSASALDAQEQIVSSKEINQTEVNDSEFYRNEYIKYMEHPSYKERLSKEMYGDEKIDEEKQKKIDREYEDRMKQIKNVLLENANGLFDSSFVPDSNKVHGIPFTFNHEFSHSLDFRLRKPILTETSKNYFEFITDSTIENGFNDKKELFFNLNKLNADLLQLEKEKNDSIKKEEYNRRLFKFVDILNIYINNNKDNIQFCHEKSFNFVLNELNKLNRKNFNVQKFYKYFNYRDQINIIHDDLELLQELESYENQQKFYDDKISKLKIIKDYYASNSEIKARLNHLRLRAKNEFNYNLNKEFDINNFEELKKDVQYFELKRELNLSDEEINELMKVTAFNNSKNVSYPTGSDDQKFKKGYDIHNLDYGEEECQA